MSAVHCTVCLFYRFSEDGSSHKTSPYTQAFYAIKLSFSGTQYREHPVELHITHAMCGKYIGGLFLNMAVRTYTLGFKGLRQKRTKMLKITVIFTLILIGLFIYCLFNALSVGQSDKMINE